MDKQPKEKPKKDILGYEERNEWSEETIEDAFLARGIIIGAAVAVAVGFTLSLPGILPVAALAGFGGLVGALIGRFLGRMMVRRGGGAPK